MGINNSPPIQLHPYLDKNQTTAFINENFRKLSDGFNPLQISDGTSNRVTIGKYGTSQYGFLGTDSDGVRRILIGQHPVTGVSGIWVSKSGVDVITELGG